MNLRAALLRCLDQAKKNGALGRDAILRKTMLDECKGERLEEVLAVFASAVLKKVVAEQQLDTGNFPSIAYSLALEKRGYTGERTELDALVLAHIISLRRKLDEKNAARLRYKNFALVLDAKEEAIAGRIDCVKENGSNGKAASVSDQQCKHVRRAVKNNWAGNERWMETLLHGDANARQDGLLSAPFDRVLRRARSDRLQELEDNSDGLLKQLDDRIRAQQKRLAKWKALKKDMFGDEEIKPSVDSGAKRGRQKGLDFGFETHESLQLGRLSPHKFAKNTTTDLDMQYRELLRSFERDVKTIDQVPTASVIPRLGRREQPRKPLARSDASDKAVDEPISELSELEEEIAKVSVAPEDVPRTRATSGKEELSEPDVAPTQANKARRPKLPQPLFTMHAFRPKTKATEISPIEPIKPDTSPKTQALSSPYHSPMRVLRDTSPSPVQLPTPSVPPSQPWPPPQNFSPRPTQSPDDLLPSPTQQQADLILASMNAASPSPGKPSRPRPTLSLAERTRLSMSRSTTLDFDDEEMTTGSPTHPRRRNTSSRSPKKNSFSSKPTAIAEDNVLVNEMGDEDSGLVARTRRSMANFEAAQQKARLERQRSLKHAAKQSSSFARQKYFPAVGEEEADGNSTTEVLEELIAKEEENQGAVNYESIFKSRPKIKSSPPGTPARNRGFSWDGEDL